MFMFVEALMLAEFDTFDYLQPLCACDSFLLLLLLLMSLWKLLLLARKETTKLSHNMWPGALAILWLHPQPQAAFKDANSRARRKSSCLVSVCNTVI